MSDRLLTQRIADQYEEWDAFTNKTIVFLSTDAFVVLGFSGEAFIAGTPTDSFIAGSLMRASFEEGAIHGFHDSERVDLGQSLDRVRSAVEQAWQQEHDTKALLVQVDGWRFPSRGGRLKGPVSCRLEWDNATRAMTVAYDKTVWRWALSNTGSSLWPDFFLTNYPTRPTHELDNLRAELPTAIGTSPTAIDEALVRGVHAAAEAKPRVVGKATMSVVLAPGNPHRAYTRYRPAQTEPVTDAHLRPFAYTPWVVGPGLAYAPSLANGGWETPHLHWSVRGLPEQATGPRTQFFSSQPRRHWP